VAARLAAVMPCDLPHQRQSQPHTVAAFAHAGRSVEGLEDSLALRLWNA
jgi:hypothetical protein